MSRITGSQIPLWAEIKHHFDLDAVVQAVRRRDDGSPETRLTAHDLEDVGRMLWRTAETWLGIDLLEFHLGATEQNQASEGLHGILDLQGTLRGLVAPFTQFPGAKFVLDWKTRDGRLSDDWRERHRDSWQWQYYADLVDARVFIYRGISRQLETAQILLRVPDNNGEQVRSNLAALEGMRKALDPFPVWPQFRPDACSAYGYECPYKADCDNYTMPHYTIENVPHSYSALKTFTQCPERYRRSVRDPNPHDNPATIMGNAFHRGVAELYKQAAEVKL